MVTVEIVGVVGALLGEEELVDREAIGGAGEGADDLVVRRSAAAE